MTETTTSPIEFKDIFISYGRRESLSFVARLHQTLQLAGYDCWFDKVNIPDGTDYAQRINYGIESAHNFLYVMAPRSMHSVYCLIELEYAKVLGKRIIPINNVAIDNRKQTPLSDSEKKALAHFYWLHHLPNPELKTKNDIYQRTLDIIGSIDWLDAKEEMQKEDCDKLFDWAVRYENEWHKHQSEEFLNKVELPSFGNSVNSLESVLQRLKIVLNREHHYVYKHTEILQKAKLWDSNQRKNQYLNVGEERKEAENWLLQPFSGDREAPCQPSKLHCEFICESRKNAENLLTDVFICSSRKDNNIKEKVITSISKFLITAWEHKQDIQKGSESQKAIKNGIEGADNFIFFISSDSLTSEHCKEEYKYARSLNKRIIPLLIKPVETTLINTFDYLSFLQFIDFTDNIKNEDYDRDIDEIISIIQTENTYYKEHKKLLIQGLKWQKNERAQVFLLRGFNLDNAQTWLRINNTRKEQKPLKLHHEFIDASIAAKGSLPTDVFISYSRKDSDFARRLNNTLQEAGKRTWFDQESISGGVDFQAEIYRGIQSSDNFLFIISPDAVDSPYCIDEVGFAAEQNKRMVSILARTTSVDIIPEALKSIQWLDFESEKFDKVFAEFIQVLEIDREHARQHTVIQERAIEWNENEKVDDFLLNVKACNKALDWLKEGENKSPLPSVLQKEYINRSKEAILYAEKIALETSQKLKKRLQLARLALGITLILLIVAGYFYWKSNENLILASEKQKEAVLNEKIANEKSNDLVKKQNELEKEKTSAIAARDTAELRRVESEEIRLELEIEKNKIQKALKESNANRIITIAQGLIEKDPTTAFNLLLWAKNRIQGNNKFLDQTLSNLYNQNDFYNEVKLSKGIFHESGNRINAICFSPNGNYFITGASNGNAKLWNIQGDYLLTLVGHKDEITSIAFSPNGKDILTGSLDKSLILWDINGNMKAVFGNSTEVTSVAFSPNGKFFLVNSFIANPPEFSSCAILRDIQGKEIAIFKHQREITSVAFSPNGELVLTGSKDGYVKLWDIYGREKKIYKHQKGITSLAFSPDGQLILTGNTDGAKLWDIYGKERKTYRHQNEVTSVAFSPNGELVLTGSTDNIARLWDYNGSLLSSFEGHFSTVTGFGGISCVKFSPNGKLVLTSGGDGRAKLWDLRSNELLNTDKHTNDIFFLSKNKKYIITASYDRLIKIWDLNGKAIHTIKDVDLGYDDVLTISPSGQNVFIFRDKQAYLWNSDLKKAKRYSNHPIAKKPSLAVLSDKFVLKCTGGNSASLWGLNGNKLKIFSGHTSEISAVNISSDNKYVLTGSDDNTAKLWDLMGNCLQTFEGHNKRISVLTISSDNKYILTGSDDNTARLWDLMGNCLQTFEGHSGRISAVSISDDGKYILTGSNDNTAKLWDREGKVLKTLKGHSCEVSIVAFQGHDKGVTACLDNSIKIWNFQGMKEEKINKNEKSFITEEEFSTEIQTIDWSPDAKHIFYASYAIIEAEIIDLNSKVKAKINGHDFISAVAFLPNMKNILTGGYDKTTKLWDITNFEKENHNWGNNETKLEPTLTLQKHLASVNSITFSSKYQCFVTLENNPSTYSSYTDENGIVRSHQKVLKVWDLNGKMVREFIEPKGSKNYTSAIISPDGNTVAVAYDNEISLWDLKGNKHKTYRGHSDMITDLIFLNEGFDLVSSSRDGRVNLWDIKSDNYQTLINNEIPLKSINISTDGKYILTLDERHSAKLWNFQGILINSYHYSTSKITAAALSPNGKYVAIGDTNGDIDLWQTKLILEDYIKKGNYNQLSKAQKIKYGLINLR